MNHTELREKLKELKKQRERIKEGVKEEERKPVTWTCLECEENNCYDPTLKTQHCSNCGTECLVTPTALGLEVRRVEPAAAHLPYEQIQHMDLDAFRSQWRRMYGGQPGDNPKTAAGAEKTQHWLVPTKPLVGVANVMELGARKYGPFSWLRDRVTMSTYYSAARRHLDVWFEGDDTDAESGEHPLDHVISCCLIIRDAEMAGMCTDDRPQGQKEKTDDHDTAG